MTKFLIAAVAIFAAIMLSDMGVEGPAGAVFLFLFFFAFYTIGHLDGEITRRSRPVESRPGGGPGAPCHDYPCRTAGSSGI